MASFKKLEGIWIRSNIALVYGGGLGGGGGGQFGRDVVLRLTGGDLSKDGVGEDDDGLELVDERWSAI